MPQCIYCLKSGGDELFTREHVLPEAFGSFSNHPVLHGVVCGECNQFFGESIDRVLSRESIEGLERYRWGVKSPEEVERFKYSNVNLNAEATGDFDGVPLVVRPGPGEGGLVVVPRAAGGMARADGSGFKWFTPAEIEQGDWKSAPVDWRKGLKLIGDDEVVAKMKAALAAQGVVFENWRPLLPPKLEGQLTVRQEWDVSDEISRALAKISFNFAAFKFGPELVLGPSFDIARRFIRFGDGTRGDLMVAEREMPFGSSLDQGQVPVIHFLDIGGHATHRNVIGRVVLFGLMTHTVILAKDHPGPWPEFPVAHAFNVRTKESWEPEPRFPRWRHEER